MKVLFLHGWTSVPGGLKPTYLKDHGYEVLNPRLPDDNFDESVRIAQVEFDQHQPDVIVGSSRGGAVAMNINSKDTPLVLLCPAWKNWGTATTVKPNTIILHSQADDVIPFLSQRNTSAKRRSTMRIKRGMGGSRNGRGRTERTEAYKRVSKKQRRRERRRECQRTVG